MAGRNTGFSLRIDFKEVERRLSAANERAGRGSKRAALEGGQELLEESLAEVPEKTGTLADSAYLRVRRVFAAGFTAEVGYGGNGDPVNPRTGQKASEYMQAVHEDLEAKHDKGKAKFLEDPARRYNERFEQKAAEIMREELRGL